MSLESGHRANNSLDSDRADPAPGVPWTLADQRSQTIRNLTYALSFTVPASPGEPVLGRAVIRFDARDINQQLILDFTGGADALLSISVDGKPSQFRLVKDHILIPKEQIEAQGTSIEIAFRADDAALNRNSEYMYTLFVPARARLAFPCFDQPNLKARFSLELDIPSTWLAVSNGAETLHETCGDRLRLRFAETQPLPTYLFAFAAGRFQVETAERNGRAHRMFHRETDAARVERNKNAIFDLHALSLDWMETYTAIPYPFEKFDFVLIPSFQFGGMEHPGAIFYNAASLLLTESATETQMLDRANVIAHETAHMWFGDLVTMQWFNDVWLKEVFADFMAAKIANPSFPHVNHDLRFLVSHFPAAYAVDRTRGTHPIRQRLENLDEAGSLYGPIIYQKAPIVMRQLEHILGPDKLREGLRVYLNRFQFGNAAWPDLLRILDQLTDLDLEAWSHSWIEEGGRPSIQTLVEGDRIILSQSDAEEGRSLLWAQHMGVLVGTGVDAVSVPVQLRHATSEFQIPEDPAKVDWVLPNGGGVAYGSFTLDNSTRSYFLQHLPDLTDPLTRGAAWVTLWEEMLERRVAPLELLELSMLSIPKEDTEQNAQLMLAYASDAYWTFLQDRQRLRIASRLESLLQEHLERPAAPSMKATYFSAFRSIVNTPGGVVFLERLWRREETIPGLVLGESDEAQIALDLAVRSVPDSAAILDAQRGRFLNPDRKAQFEFVIPAVSGIQAERDAWFESLKDVANRRHEPWVLEGLSYLHHPVRAAQSEQYLEPSLDLLLDIQRTGDIFFPARWINTTLRGHNTSRASRIVRDFLARQEDYPVRLRRTILQASDRLFRAAAFRR